MKALEEATKRPAGTATEDQVVITTESREVPRLGGTAGAAAESPAPGRGTRTVATVTGLEINAAV